MELILGAMGPARSARVVAAAQLVPAASARPREDLRDGHDGHAVGVLAGRGQAAQGRVARGDDRGPRSVYSRTVRTALSSLPSPVSASATTAIETAPAMRPRWSAISVMVSSP
jgi:hypothetical protein